MNTTNITVTTTQFGFDPTFLNCLGVLALIAMVVVVVYMAFRICRSVFRK